MFQHFNNNTILFLLFSITKKRKSSSFFHLPKISYLSFSAILYFLVHLFFKKSSFLNDVFSMYFQYRGDISWSNSVNAASRWHFQWTVLVVFEWKLRMRNCGDNFINTPLKWSLQKAEGISTVHDLKIFIHCLYMSHNKEILSDRFKCYHIVICYQIL